MAFSARAHVDATWRSGPRGHARVLAWHTDDVYIYILEYLGYRTYKHSIEEFKLTFTSAPHFKLTIRLDFFGVELKVNFR